MKLKTVIILSVLLLLAGTGAGAYWHHKRALENRPKEYETAAVTRSNIERVIVSTGTLDPVGSVEVGTQVSGTVDKVLVDFNDTVRAGQIIAEIDRSVLMSKLTEAQASLSRAEAIFSQSEQEFKRGELLFEKGLISEQDFVRLRTDYQSQRASLQVSKAAVNTAAENVRYATIRSPVRGTVISRSVEVGQTVAASLSAPTLFIIAEDLRRMKIMAQVDETDIGRIQADQKVRFTVQAYPDKIYGGLVNQVRLQPEIVQNVVTYTVVILADNDDGTLLPGMTANVEFIEAREEDALTVPMSAFRFQPPEEVAARFEEERKARFGGKGRERDSGNDRERDGGNSDSGLMTVMAGAGELGGQDGRGGEGVRGKQGGSDGQLRQNGQGGRGGDPAKRGDLGGPNAQNRPARPDGGQGRQAGRDGQKSGGGGRRQAAAPGSRGVLWTLDANNEFKPIYVRIGLNDGVRAVVTGGEELQEGLNVVTGEAKRGADKSRQNQQNRSIIPQQQRGGTRRL